ncbi:hypothetical protein PPGU19_098870 (plasmid) [Paraburkholderia sp. PGU19]|uniref:hypothetical protein n=1 Tax=Paraburkholderia sp. PGU19 TaxID=2735434 RepID=UPI0015DCF521|nr:hypothetical protein [Paraburkholderia sp. PGU19]BCG05319.1 hypothetical protein PPGU19_098870 [Paraburkholderia sp. PGU19]
MWLLVVKPALAGRFGEARVQREQTASRATALLGEILSQELSRLHAGLFEAYMATRKVQHR